LPASPAYKPVAHHRCREAIRIKNNESTKRAKVYSLEANMSFALNSFDMRRFAPRTLLYNRLDCGF